MMAPWVEGVCAAGRRPPAGTEAGLITSVLFGLKFRSVAVACAISFVPKRGKALSSQTAHGHQAPRPSVFAQDDGRRTEPATTQLRRMVPRVGARPNAASEWGASKPDAHVERKNYGLLAPNVPFLRPQRPIPPHCSRSLHTRQVATH